jgi:hypothetical protein
MSRQVRIARIHKMQRRFRREQDQRVAPCGGGFGRGPVVGQRSCRGRPMSASRAHTWRWGRIVARGEGHPHSGRHGPASRSAART